MASYDTLGLQQSEGTALAPRSGIRLRYASNGTVRARAQSSATRLDATLVHKAVSKADWQALLAFHEANRGASFSVTFQPSGTSLNCLFAERPFDVSATPGANRAAMFDVTVHLVQAD